MSTTKVLADAVGQFLRRQQASRLHDMAPAVHPMRLNPVEPRTLDRQVAGHDTHALAALAHLAVVLLNPMAHELADVPRGVVPDHEQGALADLLLVDGDPTAHLDLIADPDKNFLIIMKDGAIYKNSLP